MSVSLILGREVIEEVVTVFVEESEPKFMLVLLNIIETIVC